MRLLSRNRPRSILSPLLFTILIFFILLKYNFLPRGLASFKAPRIHKHIQECPCLKKSVFFKTARKNGIKSNSTCSDSRSWSRTGQNVVSYTYHNAGGMAKAGKMTSSELMALYKIKILENLDQMRKFHPGYILRIYGDSKSLDSRLCKILCNNSDVHWCDIGKTPSYGNLTKMYFRAWRFLPLGDPTVDIFLSRDLDYTMTEHREATVGDWLENTTKSFHVVRDHPNHFWPLMAGLWGARNSRLGKNVAKNLQLEIIKTASSQLNPEKTFDQQLLIDVIWQQHKNEVVAYDSYHCLLIGNETLWRPFSVQRNKNETNKHVCPENCRPSFGKNWSYC